MQTRSDERKVVLIYCSKSADDVLLSDEIDSWARAYPHRLTVVHVIGARADEAPPADWPTTDSYVVEGGWVDERKVEKYAFAPADDTMVLVCGLPPFYSALCGPRDDKHVRDGSVLGKLGYTSGMVTKL